MSVVVLAKPEFTADNCTIHGQDLVLRFFSSLLGGEDWASAITLTIAHDSAAPCLGSTSYNDRCACPRPVNMQYMKSPAMWCIRV